MPVMEGAAAMLQAPLPLDLIGMNDFHDFPCAPSPPVAVLLSSCRKR
jgi:hypothetical protein